MDYEIIATLGPSSAEENIWQGMLAAGVTGFRLNTSHLSVPQLSKWLARLDLFLGGLQTAPPLVLDLQGSKWRLGTFAGCELKVGDPVELVYAESSDQVGRLPVPHLDFFKAASSSGSEIVLNDARVRLKVESAGPDRMQALVLQGGSLSAHKGITFASSGYRVEALSEKDRSILEQTRRYPFVRYAISYVKDAAEMSRYRNLAGADAYLVAKLERGSALADVAAIDQAADELWVCRGDLGAELGLRGMAESVQQISSGLASLASLARLRRPVFMAGQVLEHMTRSPTPTRSEVCYLLDTLARGYRGFVLSDETAIGRYPVESCRAAALFRGSG